MKLLTLGYLLLLGIISNAQTTIESRIIETYNFENSRPGEVFIKVPVNFDASHLLATIPDSLNNLIIQRIDLVYTVFASSPKFNQTQLNKQRISNLKKAWPKATDPKIQWSEIGQGSAKNSESAKKLFHGFVIYYRPTPTVESIKEELSFIDDVIKGKMPSSTENKVVSEAVVEIRAGGLNVMNTLEVIPYTKCHKKEIVRLGTTADNIVVYSKLGCYNVHIFCRNINKTELAEMTDSITKLSDCIGLNTYFTGIWKGDAKDVIFTWASMLEGCAIERAEETIFITTPNWFNSADYNIVEEVYNRNPTWNNTLIIMDVTGSMSPYIAKTMVWAKATQKSNKVTAYTFFNDGDSTPDYRKIIGHVGGIYSVKNTGFDAVYSEMKSTMKKGGGGDAPENNIEATLKAIKEYPNANEIVMVADNYANPRDLALIKKIKKPVHVILCGGSFGANIEYVRLAYETGGSVHTIEEDLEMRGLKAGKTFNIGNTYFTFFNGRIEVAKNKASI